MKTSDHLIGILKMNVLEKLLPETTSLLSIVFLR
jgi:hypothetical protein